MIQTCSRIFVERNPRCGNPLTRKPLKILEESRRWSKEIGDCQREIKISTFERKNFKLDWTKINKNLLQKSFAMWKSEMDTWMINVRLPGTVADYGANNQTRCHWYEYKMVYLISVRFLLYKWEFYVCEVLRCTFVAIIYSFRGMP